ncbi:ankyrin repeat domain-containing protein [Aspergillus mulundensis]|uniref:Uncharacterized protein n=1 Tax=Aspergillus mulundensis TaxID=1810919 RepID=A0A3D8RXX3_9EURO|nr:hypothetical protein DSM5745_05754 [Aspergillus mulundensis]RDW78902.1 hypothetical protein DSM5745_05754 [Aspergillus mulundensis]
MSLSALPVEIISNILTYTSPLTREPSDSVRRPAVVAFFRLRLVCRLYDRLIVDYFLTTPDLYLEFINPSADHLGLDPTPAGKMAMGHRLLLRQIERAQPVAGKCCSKSSLLKEIVATVNTAVVCLSGEDGTDPAELRRLYTHGLVSAIVDMARPEMPLMDIVKDEECWVFDETDRTFWAIHDPSQQDFLDMALTVAATLGRLRDMKVLMRKGARILSEEPDDEDDEWPNGPWVPAALHGAAIGGHVEVMKFLVEGCGLSADLSSYNTGERALHYAARGGHADAVGYLLGLGAKPDVPNDAGQSPLCIAAGLGHGDIAKKLLHLGFDDEEAAKRALEDLKAAKDQPPRWKPENWLSRYESTGFVDVNGQDGRDRTALTIAVEREQLACVEAILSRADLDVNCRSPRHYNQTPLAMAACFGREDMFDLLWAHPDIDTLVRDHGGYDVLIYAAQGGNENIVKKILQSHPRKISCRGRDGSTALMWAAARGHDSVVKLLMAHDGIDVNASTEELHVLIENSDPNNRQYNESAERVAAQDGRIFAWENDRLAILFGHNALDAAARAGRESTVKLLLEDPRVDRFMADRSQRIPLINAAIAGELGVVRVFLARDGEDVNWCDHCGETAITNAAAEGHRAVVESLLQYPGIDIRDMLAAAASGGHEDIVKWLIESSIVTDRSEIEEAMYSSQHAGHQAIYSYLSKYWKRMAPPRDRHWFA